MRQVEALLQDPATTLTITQRDNLMLAAMRDVYNEVRNLSDKLSSIDDLRRRVENLERKSIILWAEKHPKTAALLGAAVLTLINLWFVSDFRKAILVWMGLPPDLLP